MQYVHVKVTAGARKEVVEKKNEDHFLISVKEKAERNMANIRVLELIAKHFQVPKNKVRIVNGHMNHSKLVIVED